MEHEQQYKELLTQNSAENNLLVLNLLQSQENLSKQKALNWIFQWIIPNLKELQQEQFFYFGTVGLSFIFHHITLKEIPPLKIPDDKMVYSLHKAVLICRIQKQKQSKILYKIDYIEEASNLLEKYKQYLLEHLEQIVRNFVLEMET